MLIDPQNLAEIQALATHDVAFPNINYVNFENLDLPNPTILAAYTIINDRMPEYLNGLQWENPRDNAEQNRMLGDLYAEILHMINNVDLNNHQELRKIFIYIQLWGGIAGRNIFLHDGGFEANFNLEQYRLGIMNVRGGQHLEALNVLNGIGNFGTAFATKHMHFWSNGELPIYDSVIAKLVFGRPIYQYSATVHYAEYINALDDLIKVLWEEHNEITTRQIIERNLFNWASTVDGKHWLGIRVPSKRRRANR